MVVTLKGIKAAFLLAALWILAACSSVTTEPLSPLAETDAFKQGKNGLVELEAEAFNKNTAQGAHAWKRVTAAEASGKGALQALPDRGTNNYKNYTTQSPRLDFVVDFSRSGTHYVWVRGKAISGKRSSSNSVHVGLNGKAQRSAKDMGNFGTDFAWLKSTMSGAVARIDVPSAGQHTLNVWMREDGFAFDKLALSPDPKFVPSDEKPAAAFAPEGGNFALEAEAFHAKADGGKHAWKGQKGALQALPDIGTNRNTNFVSRSPRLDYRLDVARAGTYYVWVRGKAVSGRKSSSNSVHVGLSGKAVSSADRISGFGTDFGWEKGTMDGSRAKLKLPKGVHTLNVWMREDGFAFDKIILTPDANFVPGATATPIEKSKPGEKPAPVYSSPLVITKGGIYSGNWESKDARTPAVRIRTSQPVTIENATIRSKGHLIHAEPGYNANVTVRNVVGYGLNPNVVGRTPGRFLVADTYAFVRVENSYMESTSGIWLHRSRPGATVKILRNRAKNIDGRRSNGRGGWRGDDVTLVQFAQFDKGERLKNTEVAWNEIINEPYKSRVEDVINFYATSGTSSSPVRIHNNYIQGAYPANPAKDGFSGGGIMLGDAGGAHLHAFDNQVVSTANYGVAIAGGQHNRFYNNRVISSGRLADGTPIASQNVGLYIWNNSKPAAFGNNVGYNNLSGWVNRGQNYAWANYRNDWWAPDAAQWRGNKNWSGKVDRQAEAAELNRFRTKLAQKNVTVGPRESLMQAAK